MTKITDLVRVAVAPIIAARQDELVDLEYVQEKGKNYLRIYVDRQPQGIDIKEIADLSELVSEKLDQLDPDPFPNPYVLELSSPGVERPLKNEHDWQQAVNQYIHVGLYQKITGQKIYEGTLTDLGTEQIKLEVKNKTRKESVTIPRKLIANARLAIEF